ncbi:MAG: hypothetical protein RIQ84_77 [Pseudomonadota bacterium]|jgi:Domain of unknown function (DUF1854)
MPNEMTSFTLSRNSFGQLCLVDQVGQMHEQVVPVRAFPISHPHEAIAIVDRDGHELVWLDRLDQVNSENQRLIEEELASREFMPVLTRINYVSTFATPSTWQVETNRGPTEFILRGEENIRRVNKVMYLISDTHGVQYLIQDIQVLDKHSRRLLDRFL